MSTTSGKDTVAPIDKRTIGGVSVAIYRNEVEGRTAPLYKVSRKRWYKDKESGKPKGVTSLLRDDLPIAQELDRWAWLRIHELQREDREKAQGKKASSTDVDEDVLAEE